MIINGLRSGTYSGWFNSYADEGSHLRDILLFFALCVVLWCGNICEASMKTTMNAGVNLSLPNICAWLSYLWPIVNVSASCVWMYYAKHDACTVDQENWPPVELRVVQSNQGCQYLCFCLFIALNKFVRPTDALCSMCSCCKSFPFIWPQYWGLDSKYELMLSPLMIGCQVSMNFHNLTSKGLCPPL